MNTIALKTPIPGPKSSAWVARRSAAVPRGLSLALPVFVDKAEGATIEDIDGNRFLDFTGGIGCQNAGHRPPAVVDAIHTQADKFLHTCFMITPYEGYVELAEALNRLTPGSFPKKTMLLNSGAEAVENAVKIARRHTGRQAIIAFEDAFHGRTQLAMSLTGKTHPYKAGFGPFAPEIYRLPYAYCYRCPVHLTHPSCQAACADTLESMFKRHIESEQVAAVIFEPVLGEGGFVAPPQEWFDKITAICRAHGVLVIADEVQTGFCRTGPLFACERFGLVPDLLVTAKSIAAGLPLAAVTGRADIMDAAEVGGLGGTYGGNPVACAAALATLDTIEQQNLPARAARIGHLFEQFTAHWRERFPIIGDIRGVGAMRAIELVEDRTTKAPAAAKTKAILSACHQRGLLIIGAGTFGNVIRMLVPLIATDDQIKEGLAVLEQALESNP